MAGSMGPRYSDPSYDPFLYFLYGCNRNSGGGQDCQYLFDVAANEVCVSLIQNEKTRAQNYFH